MLQHRHAKKLERKIFNFFEQVSFSLREVILGRKCKPSAVVWRTE